MIDNIEERIKKIIADYLEVPEEEIWPNTHFADDLGADSLDQAELIMAIEDDFNISIPDEEAELIKTVGEAVEYIEGVIG